MWHPWLLWYTVILVYNCTNQEIWHKLAELSLNPSNFDPKGPKYITGSMFREAGDVNCAGSSQNSTVSHTFPWDHVTCQKSFTSMWSSQIGLVSSKTQVDCGSSLSWEVTNFPDVIDECIPFIIADFVFSVPRAPKQQYLLFQSQNRIVWIWNSCCVSKYLIAFETICFGGCTSPLEWINTTNSDFMAKKWKENEIFLILSVKQFHLSPKRPPQFIVVLIFAFQ